MGKGTFVHPGGMHTIAQIQTVRENREREPWKSAYDQLIREANGWLARSPSAVEVLDIPAYYRNPERHMSAKRKLSDDASAAYALALAYQLDSSDEKVRYAEKAVEFLGAWAMTNKRVSGPDGHLVMCYAGIPLIFAAELISDYDGWGIEDREVFKKWVKRVLRGSANKIKTRPNNHGDWGVFASIAAAHLLDDRSGVLADIELVKRRISKSISQSGELPQENKRTNSGMWYTYFALAPMTGAAAIALNATGIDLFEYTAPNGRTIKQALDKFFSYCLDPYTWPYKKPGGLLGKIYDVFYPSADELEIPTPYDWPGNLYEAMSAIYGEGKWEEWVKAHRPIRGVRGWIYPTLMRADSSKLK
ncbi:MAG: alginate lyase family protein [bacterium]